MRTFEILPHKDAPVFSQDSNPQLVLLQLVQEISSPNFQTGEKVMSLIRQAALVNLWFYLKFIAGYAGPYDKINDELHLDMCNFRQSGFCMDDGARGAGFLSRFLYKSTIWTHGAAGWEVLRNPNIRIRLVNAVVGRAERWISILKNTFKFNELFKALFSEYVIPPLQADFTVPNRTKFYPEPSVKAGGATGASEGDHHDVLVMDDLVGLDDLDVERAGNIQMEQKCNWWENNTEYLVLDWVTSRLLCFTTLYSIDDPYHKYILGNMKQLLGYQDQDYKQLEKPTGEWTVYYRAALEDGEAIAPQLMPREKIIKLIEEKPWSAMTQIFNKPRKAGMSEFIDYEVRKAELVYDEQQKDWLVICESNNFDDDEIYYMSEMDVALGWDPAFTDKGISSRTSKTGLVLVGLTHDEQLVLLWGSCGYFGIEKSFEELAVCIRKFDGFVRTLVIETNAGQKMLPEIVRKELISKGLFLSITEKPSSQDKTVRIRSGIGRFLMKGNVIGCGKAREFFMQEQQVFPQSKYEMDFLDACEKASSVLRKPLSPEELFLAEQREEDMLYDETANAVTGY